MWVWCDLMRTYVYDPDARDPALDDIIEATRRAIREAFADMRRRGVRARIRPN